MRQFMDSNSPDYMMDDIHEEEYIRGVHERFGEYYSSLEEDLDENSEEYLDKYYDIYNEIHIDYIKKKDDNKDLIPKDIREVEVDDYEYNDEDEEDEEEYFTDLSESYSDDIGDLLASGHISIESLAGGHEYDVWIKHRKVYIYAKKAVELATAQELAKKLAEEKKNRDFEEYINGGNPEGYIPSEYAIRVREDRNQIDNEIDF
jgi:hypothetical protein